MTIQLQQFKHASGAEITYFTKNEIIWFSGVQVARVLNYAKPHGAIQRHVSVSNQKRFSELNDGFRFPGIPPHQIFINFHGLQELLKKNSSHPLATHLSTPELFFEPIRNDFHVFQELETSFVRAHSNENLSLSFSNLSDISETIVKPLTANGFIYLLKWEK